MKTFIGVIFLLVSFICLNYIRVDGKISSKEERFFDWRIEYTNVTRLCQSKAIMTVNGQYPGPTQYVTEGDTVVVQVTNYLDVGITIHWHGVRQFLTAWADGPAYITQCPILPNQTFIHRFNIVEQRGTLLWHAHHGWQRATLHGAFVIFPKPSDPYPFPPPLQELPPVLLGEWWTADVDEVISEALITGGPPNVSQAITINGQPGALYNCSQDEVEIYRVDYGRSYLLRVINVAIDLQYYFGIENHTMTIVEADAEYTEPYEVEVLLIAPGQTVNVVVNTKEWAGRGDGEGEFLMAASAFSPVAAVPFPTIPGTAVWSYNTPPPSTEWLPGPLPNSNFSNSNYSSLPLPIFPASNDTTFAYNFYKDSLKSQPFSRGYYYMDVPTHLDYSFFYTVGYGTFPCPANMTCLGPNGNKLAASVSNVSFVSPNISILEAYYNNNIGGGVYEANFPDVPENEYNYTGEPVPSNSMVELGTRVRVLPFNSTVQMVLQNTALVASNTHPLHLHGQNFWVVGMGLGNFNASSDPASFNLLNPVSRNTVVVPVDGWAAIRFRALNPGAWFFHCHIDTHMVWGMSMAFIVENGNGEDETLPPPPPDLPRCQ